MTGVRWQNTWNAFFWRGGVNAIFLYLVRKQNAKSISKRKQNVKEDPLATIMNHRGNAKRKEQ